MIADSEKEVSSLLLNYHHIDKYNIPSLGPVEVYRHRFENDQLMKKTVNLQNLSSEEVRAAEVAMSLAGPGLIDIVARREIASSQHELFLEDIVETLADEIQIRQGDGNRFSEIEILSMLSNALCALTKMQQSNLPHGQISPDTIFKTPRFEYKLLHPLAIGEEPSKTLKESSFLLYRAPELEYLLSEGKAVGSEELLKFDPFKMDVFSFGATIIDACSLDLSDLDLELKLDAIKNYYSFPLTDLLEKMIERNHLIRGDPLSMLKCLKQFDLVPEMPETTERWNQSRRSISDSQVRVI